MTNHIPAADARRFAGFDGGACFVAHWHRRTRSGYSTHYCKEVARTSNGHRLAFTLLVGAPVGGEMVLHRCGNASCLNVHHLYVGGDGENLRDRLLHRSAAAVSNSAKDDMVAHLISRPPPVALSSEASWRGLEFRGCNMHDCVHAPWLASTPDGYRQLPGRPLPGDLAGAHRKVFELLVGPLGPRELVRHVCGDTRCVNPHHLVIAGGRSADLSDAYDRRKDRPIRGPYTSRRRS